MGSDPILKERLFGLTNSEGNHGEDVKEYYFYLDSTPTHSYMKYLYKYPQAAYPYDDLVSTNGRRGRHEFEYELLDTGVFDEDRYFDVFVEYAKESAEDILVQISVHNRGPEAAEIHVLPTLWFRNRWSWGEDNPRPVLEHIAGDATGSVVRAAEAQLGERYLYCEGGAPLLFTENETNTQRLFGVPNRTPFVKDGINNCVVHGRARCGESAADRDESGGSLPPDRAAGKVRGRCAFGSPPSRRTRWHRLTAKAPELSAKHFDEMLRTRRQEADEFYAAVIPPSLDADAANVMRQALAGMLWSKQFYYFDVNRWLEERGSDPFSPIAQGRAAQRPVASHVQRRRHLDAGQVGVSVVCGVGSRLPRAAALARRFGFRQAAARVDAARKLHAPERPDPGLRMELRRREPARSRVGHDLHLSPGDKRARDKATSSGWSAVSRSCCSTSPGGSTARIRSGKNAFEGGFLGLDNIGVFDRSAPLPTGGHLEQADGTAWMALFSLNMLEISIELAMHNDAYADMALKFVQHFCSIASATIHAGGNTGMWDEEDGFFYDVLQSPDGQAQRLKVRSMVGLLPLCAVTVFEGEFREKYPELMQRFQGFLDARPELTTFIHDPGKTGCAGRRLGAILDETKLRRVLARMLDENEFLSPFGIRALSRYHADHPYVFHAGGQEYGVGYLPGESDTGMFGGNSNWRGPIWMPVNALIIRALLQYYLYYGDDFTSNVPPAPAGR